MRAVRYSGLVVGLGTIFMLAGCGDASLHQSSAPSHTDHVTARQSAPKDNAKAMPSSKTPTYSVANSLQFPPAVRTEIAKQCRVPMALPVRFRLDSPLSRDQQLAIDLDVSSDQYGLDIFKRPKGSNTNQYAMGNFIGDMESVTGLGSLSIPSNFNVSRFTSHKSITLPGNINAVYYRDSQIDENAIAWGDHSWKYMADGRGSAYEDGTVGMADIIAKYVSTHGTIVPRASQGYVQSVWAGNRPLFRVAWSYDGKQWYALSMNTLESTLNTAHTVVEY